MKKTILAAMAVIFITMFFAAGCFTAPDKSMVKKTISDFASEAFDGNLWEIDKIIIDNNYTKKNWNGLDIHVYEATVIMEAKKNFIRYIWAAPEVISKSGLEDAFPSKIIKDDQGRVYGKGTVRYYTVILGFSKYGKEWRHEALDSFGVQFKFKKQVSQNAF